MKFSPRPLVFVTTLVMAVCFLSCTHLRDASPPSKAQLEMVNKAVAKYDSLMNEEKFGEIWESMKPNLGGAKEDWSKSLLWIHQKYGKILRSTPLRATAGSALNDDKLLVIECYYETEGEKGRYIDNFVWHLVANDLRLVHHQLLEYDESGHLYMTMTLKTGPGPNDYQSSKVMLGQIKRNVE